VLRCLHQTLARARSPDEEAASAAPVECMVQMRRVLSAEQMKLLKQIGEEAESLGLGCYLIGGSVRDILLGRKNLDLDVAVERDAHRLAQAFQRHVGGKLV